jgi:hypothetical protein
MSRGIYFKESQKHPLSEIYIDFPKQLIKGDFGSKMTPKEVALAFLDFGNFLLELEDDADYAGYDEGDMCAGY